MFRHHVLKLGLALLMGLAFALPTAPAALAAPPANDNFADATIIDLAGLPFAEAQTAPPSQLPIGDRQTRAEHAMRIRQQAAQAQRKLPTLPQPHNGDEDLYANRIGLSLIHI